MSSRAPLAALALTALVLAAAPGFSQPLDLTQVDQAAPVDEAAQAKAPVTARDAFVFDRPAGDGRRTLSAFPANLARGVVGVFSRDNLAPFLLGTGMAVGGHALDRRLEGLLDARCPQCGRTGATVGGLAVAPAVGAFFLAGRFAPQGSFRDATYDFAEALAVDAVWTGGLKYALHRQRPDRSDFYSLPSGHTSTMFSLATVAEQHFGWKAGLPAYLLASAVGLSRVESNKHYLSDVLAGATLGVVVGRTVTRVDGGTAGRHRSVTVGPATDPRGGGVGLGLSASW